MVVVAFAIAVVWSPVVAPLVAATGRLLAVASLDPVAGQVAEATNRPGGMLPRAPLLQRSVRAVRLRPERALGILDVPALPILDGLLGRTVPGAAALDGGGPLAQLPRPFGLQELDRAGVGTVSGLLGDLVCLLGLLGLLTGSGEVAPPQPPGRTMLQRGELVVGLLLSGGRIGEPLFVLFAPPGRQVKQAGLVAWRVVDQPVQPVQLGAQVVLAHAPPIQHLGAVRGEPLAAVAACDRGELLGLLLGGAVGRRHVHHLALRVAAPDGGFGADDAVVAGAPDRPAAGDVEPLAVLGAGDADQHLVAGDPLGLVPGGGVGQVHGAPVGVAA